MISDELLNRYHINKNSPFFSDNSIDLYMTFLNQTDYIPNKIVEAQFLGTTLDEDYTEILQAREYAREQINELLKG